MEKKYLAVAVELQILVRAQRGAVCVCGVELILCRRGLDALGYVAEDFACAQHAVGV